MSNLLAGRRPSGFRTGLALLCIVSLASCSGCQSRDSFMADCPPRHRICGRWAIDPVHTTWTEAQESLKNGLLIPESGYLEIGPDDRFAFENLPDFSFEHTGRIALHQSGSGYWWTAYDRMNEWAYIWLEYQHANGKPVEHRHAVATFLRSGTDYLLHITIKDPDTGDAMVMRKVGECTIESGASEAGSEPKL